MYRATILTLQIVSGFRLLLSMREMQTAEMMSHSAEANSHTYPTPLLGGGGGMVLARRAPPDGATSRCEYSGHPVLVIMMWRSID